ncbi:MAG: cupin domain-containing protein, partial [Acidobacteriaceae bacterium]|nr:cupin domain-containing protein [Acidobacteriaceae bacterium]
FRIHRRSERMRLPQTGVDDPTYYFESLGYLVPDRQLDPYHAEFLPLITGQTVRPHMHAGFEFLYLLDGSLQLQHGDKIHQLEPGDSVYFDAGTSHSYRCAGKTPASALIVTMQHGSASRPISPNPSKKSAVSTAAKEEHAAPTATRPTQPRLSALPSRRLL